MRRTPRPRTLSSLPAPRNASPAWMRLPAAYVKAGGGLRRDEVWLSWLDRAQRNVSVATYAGDARTQTHALPRAHLALERRAELAPLGRLHGGRLLRPLARSRILGHSRPRGADRCLAADEI